MNIALYSAVATMFIVIYQRYRDFVCQEQLQTIISFDFGDLISCQPKEHTHNFMIQQQNKKPHGCWLLVTQEWFLPQTPSALSPQQINGKKSARSPHRASPLQVHFSHGDWR